MTEETFLHRLKNRPESMEFDEVIEWIARHYAYQPVAFRNGPIHNAAGENEGSCKLFALGMLLGLDETQMLHCFGEFYRVEVLGQPDGTSHPNIRQFMKTGWAGIAFEDDPLTRISGY